MSVAHVTTGEHGDILGQLVNGDHVGVQRLCKTVPHPQWMQLSGELATCLTGRALERVPHPGSTVDLALVAGVWVGQPQGHECGRPDPATHLSWGSMGTEVVPRPFPAPAVEKLSTGSGAQES